LGQGRPSTPVPVKHVVHGFVVGPVEFGGGQDFIAHEVLVAHLGHGEGAVYLERDDLVHGGDIGADQLTVTDRGPDESVFAVHPHLEVGKDDLGGVDFVVAG